MQEQQDSFEEVEIEEEEEEEVEDFGDFDVSIEQQDEAIEKKRVIISRKPMGNVIVFEVENWCGLEYNKIVLFETSKQIIYEVKQVHLEFGCWYVEPLVISDHSFKISSALDPFFIVLHFISKHKIEERNTFSSKHKIFEILPQNELFCILQSVLEEFIDEENGQFNISFVRIHQVLEEKKKLVDDYLKGNLKKDRVGNQRGLDMFVSKRIENDSLFLYVGEYWYNIMKWTIPDEHIIQFVDDYSKYEKKKKKTTKKKKATKKKMSKK